MRVIQKLGERVFNLSLKPKSVAIFGLVGLVVVSLWLARPVSAAISLRAVSSADNGSGATSLTINTPTGAVAGDVLVASIDIRTGSDTTTDVSPAESGWTVVQNTVISGSQLRKVTFVRALSAAPPSSYGFNIQYIDGSFNLVGLSTRASGGIIAYSGVDTADPVNVSNYDTTLSSSTTGTAPSVTTTVPNAMLVAVYGAVGLVSGSTQGSSMTERYDLGSSGGGQAGAKITSYGQDATQASAGASGTKTMTFGGSTTASIGHTLALRPAPVVSQSAYRFFQNTNSGTASTPYAAVDTAASIQKQTPFRLRINLGVASGGSDLTAISARTFTLQFAKLTAASCAVQSGYADISSGTAVQFYNNPTVADDTTYVSDGTNDPSRSGITPIGQRYHEANPLTMAAATSANQDALWDIALSTGSGVVYGETYCIRVANLNGTYSVYPQFTVPSPVVSQANYRFFANADSTTPGAALAAQDTPATIAHSTPFRLRQRLAVDSAQADAGYMNYKLQFAEKVSGTCSVYSFVNPVTTEEGYAGDAASTAGSGGSLSWTDASLAATGAPDGSSAYASLGAGTDTTRYLVTSMHYLNIPPGVTIKGIEVSSTLSRLGDVAEDRVRLVKGGVIQSTDRSQQDNWTGTLTRGGPNDLWGTTWTQSDVIDNGFGVAISASLMAGFGPATAYVDSILIRVYYSDGVGNISYVDNTTAVNGATISSSGSDPTNGARSTVYQTYHEIDPFTNGVAAIPAGSDGIWDFALTSGPAADGKTYCFRISSPGGSTSGITYTHYPEITFGSGGGGGGVTTEQKLRGGRTVQNGVKSPFEL